MISKALDNITLLTIACAAVLAGAGFYLDSRIDEATPSASADGGGSVSEPVTPWRILQHQAGRGTSLFAARRAQLERFGVMRGSPEEVPQHLVAEVRDVMGAPPSLEFDRSQFARTSAGGIWIANAGRATCLIRARDGSVACDTTARVADRGLILAVFKRPDRPSGRPRDFLVLGIAPDWATAVRLRVGSTPRRVPVAGNAYALGSDREITFERLER